MKNAPNGVDLVDTLILRHTHILPFWLVLFWRSKKHVDSCLLPPPHKKTQTIRDKKLDMPAQIGKTHRWWRYNVEKIEISNLSEGDKNEMLHVLLVNPSSWVLGFEGIYTTPT